MKNILYFILFYSRLVNVSTEKSTTVAMIQTGKKPMQCYKMMNEIRTLPPAVLASLPSGENGSSVVKIAVPGSLNEATTQEALQRGQVVALAVEDCKVDGAEFLEVVKYYKDVKTVFIRNCSLGIVGGQKIARAVSCLTCLFLSGNQIQDGGAKTFAAMLLAESSLKALGLCAESIGPEGAKALAAALQTNTTLALLDLTSNRIGELGCRELALALKRNPGTAIRTLALDEAYGGVAAGESQGLLRAYQLQMTIL
jgi:hypothetical protein